MRVKHVISRTIDGATDSNVITMTICSATLTSPVCPPAPSRPIFKRSGVPVAGEMGGVDVGFAATEDLAGEITSGPELCAHEAGATSKNATITTSAKINRRTRFIAEHASH